MSSTINARYISDGFNKRQEDEEKKRFLLEQCQMTSIARFNLLDNAIAGSNMGELYAFRFPSIFIDKNKIIDFRHDRIPKREMAISKAFDALTSTIQSIVIFEDRKVFVSGYND